MAAEKNTSPDSYEDDRIAKKFAKIRYRRKMRSVHLTSYPRYDR